ncbi:hypothetical protein ACSFV5_07665 [Acinetobacter sp. HC8-3S]
MKIQKDSTWKNLNYAIKNLDDTNFILTNSIPDFWKKDKEKILQNLPLTEFDDTGFLGRKDDRKKLMILFYQILESFQLLEKEELVKQH